MNKRMKIAEPFLDLRTIGCYSEKLENCREISVPVSPTSKEESGESNRNEIGWYRPFFAGLSRSSDKS